MDAVVVVVVGGACKDMLKYEMIEIFRSVFVVVVVGVFSYMLQFNKENWKYDVCELKMLRFCIRTCYDWEYQK